MKKNNGLKFVCVHYSEAWIIPASEGLFLSGLVMLDLYHPWELLCQIDVYLIYI